MVPSSGRPDDSADVFAFSYPPEANNQPTVAIVEAVAWVKDVPVRELEPLHYSVRTDELDGLFGDRRRTGVLYRSSDQSSPPDQTVSFRYEGLCVTVAHGEIRIKRA